MLYQILTLLTTTIILHYNILLYKVATYISSFLLNIIYLRPEYLWTRMRYLNNTYELYV